MNQTKSPRWITLSEGVYQALLILYPADFRRDYGTLMVQVFRDVSRDKYQRLGMVDVIFWWLTTLLDLTITAIEERRKVRLGMSKAAFVQISSRLLIVGGALFALSAFVQLQLDDAYTFVGISRLLILILAFATLLIGLGCIGVALRYERAESRLGFWTLILTGVSSMLLGVGVFSVFFLSPRIADAPWDLMFGAIVAHAAALTFFGLAHLLKPGLPIFRALPLTIALGWWVLQTGPTGWLGFTYGTLLQFLLVFGVGVAWLAIGLAVRRQQREVALAAA
ncbi:MAG: hypothetical protein KC547_21150 [Anaerolineae bacterium]|nr:hypothetical protein [Anaerolineae bacterium]